MAKKQELKEGDLLPLTDDQLKQISEHFDKTSAYEQTIKDLSQAIFRERKTGWELIKRWFPDSVDLELNYTSGPQGTFIKVIGIKKPTES